MVFLHLFVFYYSSDDWEGEIHSYDFRKTNVSVHLLIPRYTYTGLTRGTSTSKPASAWTPDNDVTNEIDHKRMTWNLRDLTLGRPALSRWWEEIADVFEKYMKE